MKKHLCYLFVVLCLLSVSCSKTNSSSASVTFTANDINYSLPVATFSKESSPGYPAVYLFEATDHYGNHIGLFNFPDSISPGTYPNLGGEADLGHVEYAGTPITLTINSVHNGLADGTFSGTMLQMPTTTNPYPKDSVTITNGVFKNILIQQ